MGKKRAIMRKIGVRNIAWLVCLLFLVLFLDEVVYAQSPARHKSDPVKIERQEKPKPDAGEDQDGKSAESKAVEEKASPEASADQKAVEPKVTEKGDDPAKQSGDDQKQADSTELQNDALGLMGEKQDLYSRKGRVDPFEPFVQGPKPEESSKAQKKLQRRDPRTPLERLSLGQLRLTAVMEMPDENLAMVEEASGKGYVVKQGTYIGDQGGRITEVMPDAIIIEEKYLDVFGKVSVRKKQLKLQK